MEDSAGSSHPSDQTLSSYGLGKLDDRLARSVHNHLEHCAECRGRVAGMTSDSFLGRFRDARRTTTQTATVAPDGVGSISLPPGKAMTSPPPPADSLPPGLVDHADYEIRKELGRGGMGVVYLAHNSMMGRDEVLKVIGRHVIERPGVLERFQNEIRAVAKLRHPNIVAAHSAFRLDGGLVFAMEYVEGLDLAKLVKTKGPLSVPHAAYFAHQAALGLRHAHERGMVHRDIKPHNLMLTHDGKARVIKVLDFGLAKATREGKVDGGLTTEGQALGTPDYIAPEQIIDAASADIRADLYSLGGTLYYLLTGRPPFRANSLYDMYQAHISRDAEPLNFVRPEVPSELAALVAKLLAKETKRRFQTPAEVAEALTPFFKSKSRTVFPQPTRIEPTRPAPSVPARPTAPVPNSMAQAPATEPRSAGGEWHSLIDFGAVEPISPPVRAVARPVAPWVEKTRPYWIKGAAAGAVLLLVGLIGVWALGTIRSKTPHGSIVVEGVPADAHVVVANGTMTISRAGDTVTLSEVPLGQEYQIKVVKGDTTLWTSEATVRLGDTPVRLTYEPSARSATPGTTPAVSIRPVEMTKPTPRLARFDAELGEGKWTIDGDELVQSQFDPEAGKPPSYQITFGDPSWTDCDITFEAYNPNNPANFAVVFRRQSPLNFYGFSLGSSDSRYCDLAFKRNGAWKRRPENIRERSVPPGEWYRVKVELRGKAAQCYLNDELLFREAEVEFPMGQLTLIAYKTAARFRRIRVTSPTGEVLLEGLPDLPGKSLDLIQQPIDQAKRNLAETGFTPLFNSKEITGWSAWGKDAPLSLPGTSAIWSVQNGVLHGEGGQSHLFSPRGDYTDFRVRAEVKINDGGNSGIYFRASKMAGFPNGYETQINSTSADPNRTGSLYRTNFVSPVNRMLVRPDTWFVLEAEAVGNHLRVWVNGTRTVDWTDPVETYTRGHFGIQVHDNRSHVQIRKLEVMEIRPAPLQPTTRKPPADASPYHGRFYKVYTEQLSWHAAEERCRLLGGHLVVVENRDENQFLNFLARNAGLGGVWLGATDQRVEGKWIWVDGTSFGYQNWDVANKQPNNKEGLEHFLVLLTRFDGTWCDQPDDGRQEHPGFVCQWD